MTRLVRTSGGRVVHHRLCRYASASSALPWKWAEGRSNAIIEILATVHNIRPCKVCKPLGEGESG